MTTIAQYFEAEATLSLFEFGPKCSGQSAELSAQGLGAGKVQVPRHVFQFLGQGD